MGNYITRVGIGFDVHKFDSLAHEEHFIMLGGVKIMHAYKVLAHSDGDVLLHAITDAVLGAMSLGDIGDHFPPTDSQWSNANSAIFLKHALALVRQKGGSIINIDTTVMCEKPKLMTYKRTIEKSIADILSLESNQISVKATTTEKLGFTGRSEGIAAQAVCSIRIEDI